jgi:putative MATE family efflux protein
MPSKKILDTDHIFPLLIKLSIPTIIGGFASALYNMVDSIFVGKYISSDALAALTIANTIQNSFIAFSALCSVGTGTIISQSLGARKYDQVKTTLYTGIFGVFICTFVLSVFMLLFLDPILLFTGSTSEILADARTYMSTILWFGFVIPMNGVMSGILRAKGHTQAAMVLALVGATLNIGLDALFILTFGWGVFGAAFATVIAQLIVLLFAFYYIYKDYDLSFSDPIKIDFSILRRIFAIGAPSGLRLGAIVVAGLAANQSLQMYGTTAIAAMGIVNRLIALAFMSIQGCNFGAQPIIAFNFGAKRLDRLKSTIKVGVAIVFVIGLMGSLGSLFAPKSFFYLFTNDPKIAILTKEALAYNGVLFFLFGPYMILSGFIQSVGHTKEALFLALSRPLFNALLFRVLPIFYGLQGVWIVMPISDIVNTIIAIVLALQVYNKIKQNFTTPYVEVINK